METLDRIAQKIDALAEGYGDMRVEMARYNATLEEHVRRTDLLERAHDQVRAELKPLTRAHAMWAGAGKVLALLGTILGVVGALVKLLR